jgi:hypothetical protein
MVLFRPLAVAGRNWVPTTEDESDTQSYNRNYLRLPSLARAVAGVWHWPLFDHRDMGHRATVIIKMVENDTNRRNKASKVVYSPLYPSKNDAPCEIENSNLETLPYKT